MGSEVGVSVCQLEGKGGEYEMEITAVLEIARTEERCSKAFFRKETFSDRLSDRRFPRPSEPVEPKDRRLVEVFGP